MKGHLRRFGIAATTIAGAVLIGGLIQPADAQNPPVKRVTTSPKCAWWQIQLGLGPAGCFDNLNNSGRDTQPALKATNIWGNAIYGRSDHQAGIVGETNRTVFGYGVFGKSLPRGNYGGLGADESGVFGRGVSAGSSGVHGEGSTGVVGYTHGGTGAAGFGLGSGIGVHGYTEGSQPGVYGESLNGFGVRGHRKFSNDNGYLGGDGYGVYGSSPSGYAVFAEGKAGGTSDWQVTSDARFKTNVASVSNALRKVLALRAVTYDWRRKEFPDKNFDKGRHVGFIAQEVERVIPELVHKDRKGYRTLGYSSLVPVLVEAVKEQQKQIDQLTTRMASIELAATPPSARSALGLSPSTLLTGFALLGAGIAFRRNRRA